MLKDITIGSLVYVFHTGTNKGSWAIIADYCPVSEPVGEMSIAAAEALGGANVSPRDGADFPDGDFQMVLFRNITPVSMPFDENVLKSNVESTLDVLLAGKSFQQISELFLKNDSEV